MKKELYLLGALGLILVILLSILIFVPGKKENQPAIGIEIFSPKLNENISMPLEINGRISGNGWVGFEGQVGTVDLLDKNGKLIAQTYLQATTEWTSLPTNFKALLDFQSNEEQGGTLVFHNENASGLPENNSVHSLHVIIPKTETIKINIYFGNRVLSSSSEIDECKRVYPVYRYINKTQAVAKSAVEELLKGLTEQENIQGYFSNIPIGSKLNSISIANGIAKVDFNSLTESGGGSCSMASRVAQINATLKQFSTVNSVTLSIDGRTEDIFQP